jgi:ribulose-bisphosphate carboxylase large chain
MQRIEALYRLRTGEPRALARAIAVELTVEVPEALLARSPALERDFVARIESLRELGMAVHELRLSFDPALAGGGLPQLLNLLSGNVSMLPGVELVDAELPRELLDRFSGPRHGIAGIRRRAGVEGRPLVATALKPRGATVEELVAMAEAFARGGGDLIKDDHCLVEESSDAYFERIRRVRDAVRRGSAAAGRAARPCLYLALLTGPLPELERRLRAVEREGIDGVLVAPALLGLEGTRALLDGSDRIVMTHPSFTGPVAGGAVAPSFLHGFLFRLLGADAAVFVHHGGRFPIRAEECIAIAEQCRRPRGAWRPTFPVPAGGMRFARIEAMAAELGPDTILLIGGDLLVREGGVEAGTAEFARRVEAAFRPSGPV